MKNTLLFVCLFVVGMACDAPADTATSEEAVMGNPPAEGFDLEGSDAAAIALADEVMEAVGGRRSWDTTRYIYWNFFGRRTLLWDKAQGRVRIESKPDSTIYLINLKDGTGQVKRSDLVMEHPDSVAMYSKRGNSIWINDAYWLVLPYKLKDSGVTLKHMGQDTTQTGTMADVLQLTFKEVGDTPQNKYLVYVDPDTKYITQWDYYPDAKDENPRFSTPWAAYQPYGDLMLSGDRGRNKLSDIAVYQQVPEEAFTSFEPVELD